MLANEEIVNYSENIALLDYEKTPRAIDQINIALFSGISKGT